jgi:hypothetical protein
MSNTESILGNRRDILVEGYLNLDESGNYTSGWFDSAGLTHVRLAASYAGLAASLGSFTLSEASFIGTDDDSSRVTVRTQSVSVGGSSAYADLDLTARYFRLVVSGTGDNANSSFFLLMRGL